MPARHMKHRWTNANSGSNPVGSTRVISAYTRTIGTYTEETFHSVGVVATPAMWLIIITESPAPSPNRRTLSAKN